MVIMTVEQAKQLLENKYKLSKVSDITHLYPAYSNNPDIAMFKLESKDSVDLIIKVRLDNYNYYIKEINKWYSQGLLTAE